MSQAYRSYGYEPPPSSDQLPHTDGEPMESGRHVQQMLVLLESLKDAWRERTDFFVGGNMFLYFSKTQARNNDFRGPDVFVVMNTSRRERKSWVVWEEDGRVPDVVIELMSDSTEHIDRGDKMRIYGAQLKVSEYFLFEPFTGVFEGYELDSVAHTYRPKTADAQGRFTCLQMGLLLGKHRSTIDGVDISWLRWMTPNGEVLALPIERADAEAQRADAEAQRAKQLADELEALKAQLGK